jgi:hypothetical protein
MQESSHIQEVYEVLPDRTFMHFNVTQLNDIDITILHRLICSFFQFLTSVDFFSHHLEDNFSMKIVTDNFNIGIVISTNNIEKIKLCVDFIMSIVVEKNISYFKINNVVYLNNKFIDLYNIKKDFDTFTIRDNNIRYKVHQFVFDNFNNYQKVLFIGGESYVYANVLNFSEATCVVNYQNLLPITEKNIKSYLFDYQKIDVSVLPQNFEICIIHEKDILEKNTIKYINNLNLQKLCIITCNPKNFIKYSTKLKYSIQKEIIVQTPIQKVHIFFNII